MKRTAALLSAALLAGSVFAMPTYAQTETDIVPGTDDESIDSGGSEEDETAPAEDATGVETEGSAADESAETVNDDMESEPDGAMSEEPAGGLVPGQTGD